MIAPLRSQSLVVVPAGGGASPWIQKITGSTMDTQYCNTRNVCRYTIMLFEQFIW